MKTNTYSRQSMKIEILDDLENYNQEEIDEDIITQICDSLVPVYNGDLIDQCSNYIGEEFWDLWLNNEYGGETPIDILRGNLYQLYIEIGYSILEDIENERKNGD